MLRFIIFFSLFSSINIYAQNNDIKRDYTWVNGYFYYYSLNNYDFNNNVLTISPVLRKDPMIGFKEFNTSIADENGQLLFYSNGCSLRNKNHNLVAGADSINFKPKSVCFDDGLRQIQGGIILPLPETKDTFIFFHKKIDEVIGAGFIFDVQATKLYAKDTVVKVIYMNKKVIEDTVTLCEMQAVRHANGKDWWIVQPERGSNRYRVQLLNKNGPQPSFEQSIGIAPHENDDWWSQCAFSQDGKHYVRARGGASGDILFFDFDRKTGLLSNPKSSNINPTKYRYTRPGVAFSSNNRFMYVCRDSFILQYDLKEDNFLASADTVALWEHFEDGKGWITTFNAMTPAPDCKIYINTRTTTAYMHVILYPNLKGKASAVLQNKLKLQTKIARGMPNFPHFRLSAEGEKQNPCDSTIAFPLPVSTDDNVLFSDFKVAVYPNPVTEGTVNIDFFNIPTFKTAIWQLYNVTGQLVTQFDLLQGQNEYNFDLGAIPNGLYLYQVVIDGRRAQSGKVTIQH
jgi:hypothetical protein